MPAMPSPLSSTAFRPMSELQDIVNRRWDVIIVGTGVGGATLVEGSGLAGLRDRVQALDGELHLLSPEGGPTVLMVEIPCAS